jgi:hypothetical protein
MEIQLSNFEKLGHASFTDFFQNSELLKVEEVVIKLFSLQALKIGDYRDEVLNIIQSREGNFEKFCKINELLEKDDQEALFQVQKFLPSSMGARSIFTEKLMTLCGEFLGSEPNSLLVDGPAVFINRPNTQRLLYRWHSEAHYYPKRRKLLNIWFPLFVAKTKNNGTMSFKEGSHKHSFPFVEYQGYTSKSGKTNSVTQLEIPANFLTEFSEHWCEADVGDLIVFDRDMVHTSNPNTSQNYSAAVVARIWDPSEDLTISGEIGAMPYGGNIGRQNLVVAPGNK